MKIATFVNENEEVISMSSPGWVCVYEKSHGQWMNRKRVPMDLSGTSMLVEARRLVENATSEIVGCRAFLSGDVHGLWNLLLEEAGFHIWKSEGTLQEQLDNVMRRETEKTVASKAPIAETHSCGRGCGLEASSDGEAQPIDIPGFFSEEEEKSGRYEIDLASVLESNPGITSRQVLIPFMERGDFEKLEIRCTHLPRWFNTQLQISGLAASIENPRKDDNDKTLRVTVTPIRP